MKADLRRALALCLTLALLFTLSPAVAAQADVTQVSSEDAFCQALKTGGSIQLTGSFGLTAMAEIPAGVTVELDLNGQTVTSYNGEESHIVNAGTLTVRDSGQGGGIFVEAAGKAANVICLENNGSLTVKGGTFSAVSGNRTAYALYSKGPSVTIRGGSFLASYTNTSGVYLAHTLGLGGTDSVVTIEGGSFTAQSVSERTDTRCAPVYIMKECNVQLTVTGGSFVGLRTAGTNGASALRIGDKATPVITIAGGSFTAQSAGTDGFINSPKGTVNISGGEFFYDGPIFTKKPATVTGGSFRKLDGSKNDISDYLTGEYRQTAEGAVARFASVDSFEGLCAALEAGSNVLLTGSFALTAVAEVPAGKELILDLNGQTLTSDNGRSKYILNNGTLTVTDTLGGGKITASGKSSVSGTNSRTTCIMNNGDLTVAGGEISSASSSLMNYAIYSPAGNVTITGGTVKAQQNTADNAVYALGLGGSGRVEIRNATFDVTGGSTRTGALAAIIYMITDATPQITVHSGTFAANLGQGSTVGASFIREKGSGNQAASLTIGGGTFAIAVGSRGIWDNLSGAVTITGGSFPTDVSGHLAQGYQQNPDGSVTPIPDQAAIGSTGYRTLAEALAEAGTGDRVTLQTDAALTAELTLPQGVTLDLGGYTLETPAVFAYGQILDSQQAGLLQVAQDKVLFAADNGHLPVYDSAAGGYRLAQVQIQTKPAATAGVFYIRFDLIREDWEQLLPQNEIDLLLRVSGYEETYAAPDRWLTALYNDTTGRGAIKVTFLGWDGSVHKLTVIVANTGAAVEIPLQVDNNEALTPNQAGVYEIYTQEGLRNMARNAGKGYRYRLMNDIDLNGGDWTPVTNFTGSFDGNGKTISNFTLTNPVGGSLGFFANIAQGATVSDLHLQDVTVTVQGSVEAVGAIAGNNAGTVENCSAVSLVTDLRQPEELNKTYYGTLVGSNTGTVTGTNSLATTVNITESSEDFRDPGTKVNSKMALFMQDSVDYTTKTEMTAVGIAGRTTAGGVDSSLLWQDITNSTDLAPQVLQDRREAAAAEMYALCTVEWQPATTMYNYWGNADGEWIVETTVMGSQDINLGFFTYTNWVPQRGLPYAHSVTGLDRFQAYVGYYSKGAAELWSADSYYYNHQTLIDNAGGGYQINDQVGWGLYIGSDCSGQVANAWRKISAATKDTQGFARVVGTAQMFADAENLENYGILPVNGLIFDSPQDADGDGVANQTGDRNARVEAYYQSNKTHYQDALAMVSKGDALVGYTATSGHTVLAISDAVVVRTWDGAVDMNLSYVVTAEQGGSGTDSDGINRYYGTSGISNGIYTWRSTCCVDRRTTFADLVREGDGAGVAPWTFFPITCDALRNADSAAGQVSVSMSVAGKVSSNYHIVSTTVNGQTVYTGLSQTVSGYRSAKTAVVLTDAHGTIAVGTPVTVRLSNGKTYTGTFGTAGLTEAP